MAYYMEAIDTERESLDRRFRATAKRREARAVKLTLRESWKDEDSL